MNKTSSANYTSVTRREILGSLTITGIAGCLDLADEDRVDESTFTSGDAHWELGTDEIPPDSWPLPRRDARRSGAAPESIGPEPPLEPLWTVSLNDTASFRAPVVANGRVFAANQQGGVLLALDVNTGEKYWEKNI